MRRQAVNDSRNATAEELITVVSHDLRNYLSPASLRLQTLRRRAELDNRRLDVSDAIAAATAIERVAALVTDLLDTARLREGLLPLTPRQVELGPR